MDLLIENGTVLTMNDARDVIENGAVAVEDGRIRAVGPTPDVHDQVGRDADRTIDAAGRAVLPGFVSAHSHVSDILLRGIGNDRSLYDWLFNVKIPGTARMTAEEHAIASALFCTEAMRSGLTTFVEFGVGSDVGYGDEVLESKLDVYDAAGVRNVYAQSFTDREPDAAFAEYVDTLTAREPAVRHVDVSPQDTETALGEIERLIERYHGSRNGRQSVWPAPVRCYGATPEGLRGAVELAAEHDVMATTHVSESDTQDRHLFSNVEYLRDAGFLGDHTLLAHCVRISDRDIRMLAATDTRVAHNPLTNLSLGDGVAPVPSLVGVGVAVGIGLDNPSVSATANVTPHLRAAAQVHKGVTRDAGAVTAEKVLEMATRDGARAIGRADDLGSLETGKRADIVLFDLNRPQLQPVWNVASSLVYQSQGTEVETVICNGDIVVDGDQVLGIDEEYPDLYQRVGPAAAEVVDRAGLGEIAGRPWVTHATQ